MSLYQRMALASRTGFASPSFINLLSLSSLSGSGFSTHGALR